MWAANGTKLKKKFSQDWQQLLLKKKGYTPVGPGAPAAPAAPGVPGIPGTPGVPGIPIPGSPVGPVGPAQFYPFIIFAFAWYSPNNNLC